MSPRSGELGESAEKRGRGHKSPEAFEMSWARTSNLPAGHWGDQEEAKSASSRPGPTTRWAVCSGSMRTQVFQGVQKPGSRPGLPSEAGERHRSPGLSGAEPAQRVLLLPHQLPCWAFHWTEHVRLALPAQPRSQELPQAPLDSRAPRTLHS